jgi:hypothetical protein
MGRLHHAVPVAGESIVPEGGVCGPDSRGPMRRAPDTQSASEAEVNLMTRATKVSRTA